MICMLSIFLSACGNHSVIEDYVDGNMQKNIPPGNFVSLDEDVLFFDPNTHENLFCVNTNTMEVRWFCTDPTCSHRGEKCMAAGATGLLENYGGVIYAENDRQQMLKLDEDRFELVNEGVRGSFVLTEYQNQIFVSARSIDEVNVQIIMEKLGGGGHMSTAGAQLTNCSIEEARKIIRNTIDEMIEHGEITV